MWCHMDCEYFFFMAECITEEYRVKYKIVFNENFNDIFTIQKQFEI